MAKAERNKFSLSKISCALIMIALTGCLLSPPVFADGPALMGVRQIVAHRGSSIDRPECTLASIRRAIEAGATAVEVDVRLTKDGELVILHDATLDRTTNGKGQLKDRTLAEVRELDAGSWFDSKYREERVPTLKEVLVLCRKRIDVLLDLKLQGEAFAKTVTEEVKAHGNSSRIVVGVRSVEQARLFRKLLPKALQLGLIPTPDDITPFAKVGVETIRLWPRWLSDKSLVGKVRESGAQLHLNGSTGKKEEVLTLLKHQPESLSSDAPAQLVKTLMGLQARQDAKKEE